MQITNEWVNGSTPDRISLVGTALEVERGLDETGTSLGSAAKFTVYFGNRPLYTYRMLDVAKRYAFDTAVAYYDPAFD